MSVVDTVLDYIGRGWNPVPVKYRTKKPIGDEWQRRVVDAVSAAQVFNGARMNVGVQLGPNSGGLTDVDLDCSEAISIAPYILPPTKALFGRASKRCSHRLYYTDLAVNVENAAIAYDDPTAKKQQRKARLVELRIGGGDLGAQTVFPGSIHEEGEPVIWEESGEPASVDGENLRQCVATVAAASLLARCWPGDGARHDCARCVGGFLSRAGKTRDQIKIIAEAIAKAAGDPEWRDRRKAAEDAAIAHRDGKKAFGLPGMQEIFGKEIAGKVAEWLGYEEAQEQEFDYREPSPASPDNAGLICDWEDTGTEPPVSWLVKYIFETTGAGIVSGQWGTYKTFVVFDLSGAIMTGNPFIHFPVKRRGGVLFLAAEGSSQVKVRLAALRKHVAPDTKLPFVWKKDCPRLLDKDATTKLEAIAKAAHAKLMAEFGLPLVLIVIDTVIVAAGYAKSGDDNDAAVAQAIMSVLSRLSNRIGCFVLGVDHFGKNVETGTRGSSAKEGHADTVLALLGERNPAGKITDTRLAIRKRRGGESGEEIPFATRSVPLGLDEDGDEINSLVVDWNVVPPEMLSAEKSKGWPKSLRLLHRTIMSLLAGCGAEIRPWPDGSMVRGIDSEVVRAEFYKSYPAEGDTDTKRNEARKKAFHRSIKDAQGRALVGVRVINGTTFLWLGDPSKPS
jgi:AAA domain-containing protein/bifunctional DNA primase/polymerase-like protein